MTLFQHPQQLAQLKADPSLAPAFVEELCRYHTASALAIKRTAKVDIEIGGKVLSFYEISTISFVNADIWCTNIAHKSE